MSIVLFAVTVAAMSLLSAKASAATYYIAASGSDSNNGTSTSTPWLHAPGMTGCSSNCLAKTPQPGDQFILRGGDKWHFSGRGTPVGLPWTWNWAGTSGNNIYIGVNQTWHAGSSWTRPVISGDNPTSTGTSGVSSCAYADDGETWMAINGNYVTVDFLEATGMCWKTGNGLNIFAFGSSQPSDYGIFSNEYVHGWTRASSCTVSGCAEQPVIFASYANGPLTGPGTLGGWGTVFTNDVVDGSDASANHDLMTVFNWSCYDVHDSVFSGYTNIVCAHHLFHDNILTSSNQSEFENPVDHGNVFEENNSAENAGPNAWYNNLISNNDNGVTIWLNPQASTTDYVFNNVFWGNQNSANTFDVGDPTATGLFLIFNNTFENPENGPVINCGAPPNTQSLKTANNHFITDTSSAYAYTPCPNELSGSRLTELLETHAQATANGYTSSETFVYSPTSSSDPTVGMATNETSNFCSALSGDAATACEADTRYACTYNTTDHTVTCPARTSNARPASGAWDIGAYQFTGGDTTAPTVPAGLAATPASSTQINLSWNASTDPDNAQNTLTYRVYRGGSLIATTAAGVTTYSNTGLSPNTLYSYTVAACDPAGNCSAQSSPASATTWAAPAAPTGLSATAVSSTQINLSWTASTDAHYSAAQISYTVYRGGTQIATTAAGTTSYSNTGLTPNTQYTYTVAGCDPAGTCSAQSSPASATTLASGGNSTFGYATVGANTDYGESNSITATRYISGSQGGTATSISAYVASPINASPHKQYQMAVYADSNGVPGALVAESSVGTLTANAWNTVPITFTVTANTYYWLAYNTNGSASGDNNMKYDTGGSTGQTVWLNSITFGTWPGPLGTPSGNEADKFSMYVTY
jgi:chitodextrinase